MNLIQIGTSRCDVPAREAAGGTLAPLNAARTAQRAIPTYLVQAFNARHFGGILSRMNEKEFTVRNLNVPPIRQMYCEWAKGLAVVKFSNRLNGHCIFEATNRM